MQRYHLKLSAVHMDFLPHLHALPATATYAVFMLAGALAAALACALLAPIVRAPQTKETLDVAMRTTGAVTAALTLTLAFCAVQARSDRVQADRALHAEAAAISGFARIVARAGPAGEAVPPAIRAYVTSIIADEFHSMTTNGRSAATQQRADVLEETTYALVASMAGALADDLLEEFDKVEAAREARLQAAAIHLPNEFWLLILLLFLLVVAIGPLYPLRAHVIVMLAIQAAGLSALIAFLFLIERPFQGVMALSPEPYRVLQHALALRAVPIR